MRWLLALGFCFGLCLTGTAQRNVVVSVEPGVESMFNVFVARNRARATVPGWRIQVVATTDRQQLERIRQDFTLKYPSIPVNYVHTKPYYRLRAGAFETKAEAEQLKQTLSADYSGLYLVQDEIQLRELLDMY